LGKSKSINIKEIALSLGFGSGKKSGGIERNFIY